MSVRRPAILASVTCLAIIATADAVAAEPDKKWPLVIPAPHGSVILPDEGSKNAHDEFRYAAVRRVDNMLYISGVIIGRRESEGRDAAAFKLQVDRGFKRLSRILESAGAEVQGRRDDQQLSRLAGAELRGHARRALRAVRGGRRQLPETAVSRLDCRRNDGPALGTAASSRSS